jgi:hypothetical protein
VSSDGVNWFVTQGTLAYGFQWVEQSWTLSNGNITLQINTAGYSYFRAILTTVITGSGSSTLVMQTIAQPIVTSVVVGQPFGQNNHVTLDDATSGSTANVSAKGTQGTNALAVQRQMDAGRNPITFYLDQVTGITTEALATMNITKGLVAQATATAYTVTAGKTLHIQSIVATIRDTSTTLVTSRVRVRAVASGSVAANSPVVFALELPNIPGTAAAGAGTAESVDFPDGLELPGGSQLGLTHIESATTSAISVCVVGFEY